MTTCCVTSHFQLFQNQKPRNQKESHASPLLFLLFAAGPRAPASHPSRGPPGPRRDVPLRLFHGGRRRRRPRLVQVDRASPDAAVRRRLFPLCRRRCCRRRRGARSRRGGGRWAFGGRRRHVRSAGLLEFFFFSFAPFQPRPPSLSLSPSTSRLPPPRPPTRKFVSFFPQGKAKGWSPTTGAFIPPATEGGETQ